MDPKQLAALMAFPRLGQLEFDKASFRPLILPFMESEDGAVQLAAIYALFNAGAEEGDLELVLRIAEDPGPRFGTRSPTPS